MENEQITKDTSFKELYGKGKISTRTYNCLVRAGINTIEDVIQKSEEDMKIVRNLGPAGIREIKILINDNGFYFLEQQGKEIADPFEKVVDELEDKTREMVSRIRDKEALIAKYKKLLAQHDEQKTKEVALDAEIATLLEEISKKRGDNQLENRR